MIFNSTPVLGFVAWSGTGKTTLLTNIIPLLNAHGYRVGIVKHVHHKFDIDKPGKDSYRLRESGANQVIAASNIRMAFIRELKESKEEPSLKNALETLHCKSLDLILIEGYKHEPFPKIELHRSELNKPFMYPKDKHILAIACDKAPEADTTIDVLDINDTDSIANYVVNWIKQVLD